MMICPDGNSMFDSLILSNCHHMLVLAHEVLVRGILGTPGGTDMLVTEVRIELKKGVADPEGENVKKTLELLGFRGVQGVRSIKTFEIVLDGMTEEEARETVGRMCRRLLANPVIHEYSIHIREEKGD